MQQFMYVLTQSTTNYFDYSLKYHGSQRNKQNMTMAIYKEILATCIKSKKAIFIYNI